MKGTERDTLFRIPCRITTLIQIRDAAQEFKAAGEAKDRTREALFAVMAEYANPANYRAQWLADDAAEERLEQARLTLFRLLDESEA